MTLGSRSTTRRAGRAGGGRQARCLLPPLLLLVAACGATAEVPPAPQPSSLPPGPSGPPAHRRTLAIGMNHVCALASGGRAYCWGTNGHGELGTGDTRPSDTPVRVAGLAGAVEIGAGDSHSCALLGDGTVRCWGYNLQGRVGHGPVDADQMTPVAVDGLSRVTSLAVGLGTVCARTEDAHLSCWGLDLQDASGSKFSAAPLRLGGLDGVMDVAVSTRTCVRGGSGEVRCWGRGAPAAPIPGTAGATQVSVSLSHACVLLEGGRMACWGSTSSGAAASPDRATIVPGIAGARAVAAGRDVSCALVEGGKVRCLGAEWGLGHAPPCLKQTHNVGHGGSAAQWRYCDEAVLVPGVEGMEEIAAGGFGTCARRGDEITCWGSDVGAPVKLPAP